MFPIKSILFYLSVQRKVALQDKFQVRFFFISYNWRQENDIWPVYGCHGQFRSRNRGKLPEILLTVFKLLLYGIIPVLEIYLLEYFNFDVEHCNFDSLFFIHVPQIGHSEIQRGTGASFEL